MNTTILHNLTKTLILHPIGECLAFLLSVANCTERVYSMRSCWLGLHLWRLGCYWTSIRDGPNDLVLGPRDDGDSRRLCHRHGALRNRQDAI